MGGKMDAKDLVLLLPTSGKQLYLVRIEVMERN